MGNNVAPLPNMAVSTKFAAEKPSNDLAAGIQAGFGLIGYKGKVWSTRYKGEERPLMRADNSGPENSIHVVILKSPSVVSKIFYEGKFVDGSHAAPDCYSTNGVTPAIDAAKKQSTTCALCPKNAWGSRITEAGKKGKACSDSKRLAIVPANPNTVDPQCLRNAMLGGPMLLRVPAASLSDLQVYGERLEAAKVPYFSYVTRVSFVVNSPFPQFHFEPVRALNDDEADVVLELKDSPLVTRILSEEVAETAADPAISQPLAFVPPAVVATAVPPVQTPPVTLAEPAAAPVAPVQPAPEVAPAPVAATNGAAGVAVPADLEARLDALLSS